MRWSKALLGLLFLVAACVSRSPLPNVETASSVHFESAVASCTAVNIGVGVVLTAGHCISPFSAFVNGYPATLEWLNYAADVALLHVPALVQAPSSKLACRETQIGEDAMMIGDTNWNRGIYVFGKVATVEYMHQGRHLVLFDMRGAPGNSGAPIYDTKGFVIAMTVAVVPEHGNIVAAVPSSTLCALIEGAGEITPPSPS